MARSQRMSSTSAWRQDPSLGPAPLHPLPAAARPIDGADSQPGFRHPAARIRSDAAQLTAFAADMHTRPVSSTRIPYQNRAAAIEAIPPSNALRIVEKILLTDSETAPTISRFPARGAIAQLGERLHGMQEVGGSIPPGSTTIRCTFRCTGRAVTNNWFTASPSSRGLGHYPFTVATGVRIPVGTPSSDNARLRGRCRFRGIAHRQNPQRLNCRRSAAATRRKRRIQQAPLPVMPAFPMHPDRPRPCLASPGLRARRTPRPGHSTGARSTRAATCRSVATPCPPSARYCSHLPRKVFIRMRWSSTSAAGGYIPITSCQRRPT